MRGRKPHTHPYNLKNPQKYTRTDKFKFEHTYNGIFHTFYSTKHYLICFATILGEFGTSDPRLPALQNVSSLLFYFQLISNISSTNLWPIFSKPTALEPYFFLMHIFHYRSVVYIANVLDFLVLLLTSDSVLKPYGFLFCCFILFSVDLLGSHTLVQYVSDFQLRIFACDVVNIHYAHCYGTIEDKTIAKTKSIKQLLVCRKFNWYNGCMWLSPTQHMQ